jgi:membrane-associated protease RseP (regulator of RpoE activity)
MSTVTTPTTFAALVSFLLGLVNMIIPVLMGVAFVFMIWKLIDAWIFHADDPSKIEEGKTIAITGVVVFVILLSIWGILSMLRHSLVG